MNSLPGLDDLKASEELRWPVRGRGGDGDLIFLSVRNKNGRWQASAAEIGAVLSLWIYSARPDNDKETDAGAGKSGSADQDSTTPCEDWLRNGDAALRQTNIRLFGPREPNYIRDLEWYLGDGMAEVLEAEVYMEPETHPENAIHGTARVASPQSRDRAPVTLPIIPALRAVPPSSDTTGTNIVQINRNRVVGFRSKVPVDATTSSATNRYFRLQRRGRQDYRLAQT